MKKVVLFLALIWGASFAADKQNAVGLWVGDFSGWGIDYKRLNDNNTVWNVYLGDFRLGDETAMGIGLGYYFLHNIIKADASIGRFPLHWGPNLGFGFWSGGDRPNRYSGLDIGVGIAGGISWFAPTTPALDASIELVSPNIGMWRESREVGPDDWRANYNPALGLKGSLGVRLLVHLYFF
ncbi:MAG: hypothetical protein LBC85_07235 [Fibromonadaceae bacterium]|jgi:hypothetical protein|nr:hypothetical protein [Fibromonadaceae bacterium]